MWSSVLYVWKTLEVPIQKIKQQQQRQQQQKIKKVLRQTFCLTHSKWTNPNVWLPVESVGNSLRFSASACVEAQCAVVFNETLAKATPEWSKNYQSFHNEKSSLLFYHRCPFKHLMCNIYKYILLRNGITNLYVCFLSLRKSIKIIIRIILIISIYTWRLDKNWRNILENYGALLLDFYTSN